MTEQRKPTPPIGNTHKFLNGQNEWAFVDAEKLQGHPASDFATAGHNHDGIYPPTDHTHDHGTLTGLADDDHTQYYNQTRGDARYAPLAKGVTNGDSHDHNGGDGAQIAYSSLSGTPSVREKLSTARTYYVRTDGNDSNTGLTNSAGGSFLTIQRAVDVIVGLDINGQTVTIQIGDGTYTAGMTLKNVVGYAAPGNLVIRGNASNHSAVMLNLSSGIPILAENISSVWTLYDFHVQTGSAVCLYASGSGTTIQFSGLDFGTCATNHIQTNNGASVNAIGDYSISASSSYYHIQAVNRSIVVTAGRTVTIAANLTLVTFVLVENLSEILAYGMTFSLGAYSVTGARYTVRSNSVIYTAGGTNYFPGNSAGVAATGGIYT